MEFKLNIYLKNNINWKNSITTIYNCLKNLVIFKQFLKILVLKYIFINIFIFILVLWIFLYS